MKEYDLKKLLSLSGEMLERQKRKILQPKTTETKTTEWKTSEWKTSEIQAAPVKPVEMKGDVWVRSDRASLRGNGKKAIFGLDDAFIGASANGLPHEGAATGGNDASVNEIFAPDLIDEEPTPAQPNDEAAPSVSDNEDANASAPNDEDREATAYVFYLLARQYEAGVHTKKDMRKAMIFYYFAGQLGNQVAELRHLVLAKMYLDKAMMQAAIEGLEPATEEDFNEIGFDAADFDNIDLDDGEDAPSEGGRASESFDEEVVDDEEESGEEEEMSDEERMLLEALRDALQGLIGDDGDDEEKNIGKILEKDRKKDLTPYFEKRNALLVEELAEAVKEGDGEAMYEIAKMYETGDVLEKDETKAVSWYEKAKAVNNVESCIRLGQIYAEGEGVEKDEEKAFQCYLQAAKCGSAEGQYHVASCYIMGCGVARDMTKGLSWMKKSADGGYQGASAIFGGADEE